MERLHNPRQYYDTEIIRGLKGPLVEFLKASPDEQAEYLASELKLAVKASLQQE